MGHSLKWAFLALILATGGCFGGYPTQLMGDMPPYDMEVVNAHWDDIAYNEAAYFQIMSMMSQDFIPKAQKPKAAQLLDQYIYWSSVAKIYAFNGKWDDMDQANDKSHDALVGIAKIIQSNAF